MVEQVCYLKEEAKGKEGDTRKEQYRYGLEVCLVIDVQMRSWHLYDDDVRISNDMVAADRTRVHTAVV